MFKWEYLCFEICHVNLNAKSGCSNLLPCLPLLTHLSHIDPLSVSWALQVTSSSVYAPTVPLSGTLLTQFLKRLLPSHPQTPFKCLFREDIIRCPVSRSHSVPLNLSQASAEHFLLTMVYVCLQTLAWGSIWWVTWSFLSPGISPIPRAGLALGQYLIFIYWMNEIWMKVTTWVQDSLSTNCALCSVVWEIQKLCGSLVYSLLDKWYIHKPLQIKSV